MTDATTDGSAKDWIEHRREDDGELVGFLAPIDDRFIAMTVFGSPLTEPSDRADVLDVLDTSGLSCLAERWQMQVDDQTQILVEIDEASRERVVVHNVDFSSGLDHGHRFTLAAPVGDLLTRR